VALRLQFLLIALPVQTQFQKDNSAKNLQRQDIAQGTKTGVTS
jgi:hypothetical protein